ncbi:MAG: type II toxin-antitoxin system VapC family toxin [Coriobacteriia bacterium]|nr:type II toxin-antitoxin system VapC family toxin [Coriobacteriia bacterium]
MSVSPSATLVVDSSVALKWFKPDAEAFVPEALDLLAAHRSEAVVLAAPVNLRLEVLNALWSHRLDTPQLREVVAALEGFGLAWFEADVTLLDSAAEISVAHSLTIYDALFAALALRLDAELVTADRTLAACRACRTRFLGEGMR